MNNYSSKLLEQAVDELSRLPGIGRRTALRLSLHLLREEKGSVEVLGNALIKMRNEITYCRVCYNISDHEVCSICSDYKRDRSIICVVEDIRDVMAIEKTTQYRGLYHVLGGIISPMDGVGPKDLTIEKLVERLKGEEIREVVFALAATIEGDTTNYYIFKQLQNFDLTITTIARGVSVGDELEYADEITLGRSIMTRVPYQNAVIK
ncbi:MAG: recombination mediator RecR [Bacteroidales bacterium]|nr:recombination mediator RecR [Bacteroidales bacterium]